MHVLYGWSCCCAVLCWAVLGVWCGVLCCTVLSGGGLGWAGLGWAGLGWARLGWAGLGWARWGVLGCHATMHSNAVKKISNKIALVITL